LGAACAAPAARANPVKNATIAARISVSTGNVEAL
jgi:hypothetical protein